MKDAAAEAANVSDPARESPLIERIHPSPRSPDGFRGAFAPRTTARRVRGRARGHQKPGLKPTDHLVLHLRDYPTPARGIRAARVTSPADTSAKPHDDLNTDLIVPPIAKQSDQPTIGGGYNLLKRIRRVYAHDERPYHAFLAILIRFRNAEFTTEQVRAPPVFRIQNRRKLSRSNRPWVYSIVRAVRGAISGARARAPALPATPPTGPFWN